MWLVWLIATLITARYALLFTPQRALFSLYLPLLIFIPATFKAKIPGIPLMTISQVMIIPIFLIALPKLILSKWSIGDGLIILYIGCCVYSQFRSDQDYIGEDRGDTLNLLAILLTVNLAPYLLGRYFIFSKYLTVKLAKRLVFFIFIIVLISAYEERFYDNPFLKFLGPFFPADQLEGSNNLPALRYGFIRIKGSFPEAISFATVIGIVLFLNYWLIKNKFWEKKFFILSVTYFSKGIWLAIVLVIGLIFTFSRGPFIGIALGSLFIGIGFSKHRWLSLLWRSLLVSMLILCAMQYINHYAGVDSSLSSIEDDTIAYRKKLLDNYIIQGLEYPYWGWNFRSLPKDQPLPSIDNHYLLLFLTRGIVVVIFFIAIIIYYSLRLLVRGIQLSSKHMLYRSLAFTFFSILLSVGSILATVALLGQMEPLLFLLIGWIEGYLRTTVNYDFSHPPLLK